MTWTTPGVPAAATISGAVILNEGVQMGDDGDIFESFIATNILFFYPSDLKICI